ncbi:MAG: zin-ion binding putative hydrolase [Erysipelotrichaceae bacterium]|nr:MAG: putative zin-ion binding [Erysipelotrichaceae bacterium]TXT17561.1 MAG: zin-ion binding putative hydrolase [Erysipelotrichaceae bacterium]
MLTNITLIHEHMTIDLSGPKNDNDCFLDILNDGVVEIMDLYKYGVRRIVECSNRGIGRNVRHIVELEKKTGIRFEVATGFYKSPFFPPEVEDCTVDELAEIMVREITEGIDGIRKAGLIGEIGTSLNVITPHEEKVFLAACIAHKATGVPIITHTTLGTMGDEQVAIFLNHHIDLKKVLISHVDLKKDFDYIVRLLQSGVNVGFDTIGKTSYLPDEVRLQWIVRLVEMGYIEQIFMSMDITRKSHLHINGGIGYRYLFETFIPSLEKNGLTQVQIEQMLSINPVRFLGGNT